MPCVGLTSFLQATPEYATISNPDVSMPCVGLTSFLLSLPLYVFIFNQYGVNALCRAYLISTIWIALLRIFRKSVCVNALCRAYLISTPHVG